MELEGGPQSLKPQVNTCKGMNKPVTLSFFWSWKTWTKIPVHTNAYKQSYTLKEEHFKNNI